jgi:beta-lactamase class A
MRTATLVAGLVLTLARSAAGSDLRELEATFDRIIRTSGGDVGVALVHVESGARISINGDQRFPMASVYKLPIALSCSHKSRWGS